MAMAVQNDQKNKPCGKFIPYGLL